MKKVIVFLMMGITTITLLLYCYRPIAYPFSQKKDAIVQIDIVEIDDYRIINTGNFDMITICKSIDQSKQSSFVSKFEDLHCHKSRGPSQECLEGRAVRFTYNDGAFEIVGAETAFYCTANKDWSYPAYYYNYNDFNNFLLLWM